MRWYEGYKKLQNGQGRNRQIMPVILEAHGGASAMPFRKSWERGLLFVPIILEAHGGASAMPLGKSLEFCQQEWQAYGIRGR